MIYRLHLRLASGYFAFKKNMKAIEHRVNFTRIITRKFTREMITKLTLTIDKKIIDAAKKHAKENGKSLSALVENYLKTMTTREGTSERLSPKIESLMGIAKVGPDFNEKEEMGSMLIKKHIR
jgi:hypothetical protein